MIISHKHKFIFIKTKKTAGTSIEIALSKICGDNDIISAISPEDEEYRKAFAQRTVQNDRIPFSKLTNRQLLESLYRGKLLRFRNHMSCKTIKSLVSEEVWNSYYKFTFERNPFDKVVSFYYWMGGDKRYNSIYEFLTQYGLSNLECYNKYMINGLLAVDRVYRYENMNSFCDDISEKLGLEEPLRLPPYKAKSHTRKNDDYKAVLDEKSIELIKVCFAREIKLFNYKF